MERRRARLPRSDSGRLIRSSATLTSSGTAASAPMETSVMAAACRTGRLILSAINIPSPRPNAVRVKTSKLSSGSCSGVFGMDNGGDIAYVIRLVLEKETGKSSRPGRTPDGAYFCNRHVQSDLCACSGRWKWRTFLAGEPARPSQTTAPTRIQKSAPRGNGGEARWLGS